MTLNDILKGLMKKTFKNIPYGFQKDPIRGKIREIKNNNTRNKRKKRRSNSIIQDIQQL